MDRIQFYDVLWKFCNDYHSGQWSRGYRILSRLYSMSFRPSLSIQRGEFESREQRYIYALLKRRYGRKI